jgi:hypothetical protein
MLVVPAFACVKGEGCGNWIGPEGGQAISNAETCEGFLADVRVPEGALDDDVEGSVSCTDVPSDFPAENLGPQYEFAPVDLTLSKPAKFTMQYSGDEGVALVWRASGGDGSEWTDLSIDLTRTTYADGRPALRFEFDRFGYFVVVKP